MGAFYKRGDKVIIRVDLGNPQCNNHFGVTREMREMTGNAYTISKVTEKVYTPSNPLEDGCEYRLEGDPGSWSWSSEAFIPTKPFFNVGDTVMIRMDLTEHTRYDKVPFSVNGEMAGFAGKTAVITAAVRDAYTAGPGLDGCEYYLDTDHKFYRWANEDFVLSDTPMPLLKVGDEVTVREDLNELYSGDVQYGLDDTMREYAGKTVTITKVTPNVYGIERSGQDGCLYRIKEDNKDWSWSSEMFNINQLKTKKHEVKLQGKEVAVSRGDGYTGSVVRSGRCKASITVGHLSHKAVTGN